jgi:16S rRNA U516 pseudouridylate synthase RsuA-like enzyme
MNGPIRLQKFLAAGGVASRRAAERLIKAGKVKVNGIVVRKLGTKIDPRSDKVEVNNAPVNIPTKKNIICSINPGVI